MSKREKFAGSMGGTRSGDSASGGNKVNGGTAPYAPPSTSVPKGSDVSRRITMEQRPGDNMGTGAISSHNNISTFLRGAKSRGPYGGPSFRSINNVEQDMMKSNTSAISDCPSPSASGRKGAIVGGARGQVSTKAPSRTPSKGKGLNRGRGTGNGNAGYGTRRGR